VSELGSPVLQEEARHPRSRPSKPVQAARRLSAAERRARENYKSMAKSKVCVFVKSIPRRLTRDDAIDFFSAFGHVAGLVIITDRQTGDPIGRLLVRFSTEYGAKETVDAFRRKEPYVKNKLGKTAYADFAFDKDAPSYAGYRRRHCSRRHRVQPRMGYSLADEHPTHRRARSMPIYGNHGYAGRGNKNPIPSIHAPRAASFAVRR